MGVNFLNEGQPSHKHRVKKKLPHTRVEKSLLNSSGVPFKSAVECKNYGEARLVGIKEIRDFQSKLQDLSQINHAMFVVRED